MSGPSKWRNRFDPRRSRGLMGTLGMITQYPATTVTYNNGTDELTFTFERQFVLGDPVRCVVFDTDFGEQEFNDARVSADGKSLIFSAVDLPAALFMAILPGVQDGFNPQSYWKNATSWGRVDNT